MTDKDPFNIHFEAGKKMHLVEKRKILVVDNNPAILKFISSLLITEGHEVFCAEDVLSGLDILVDYTPDIIFLDLVMPKINGDDFCRIIRGIDYLQDCYIVLVSGISLEKDYDFRGFGANECIAKCNFKEMGKHIVGAVRNSTRSFGDVFSDGIKGAERLLPRQVTKELLEQSQHFREMLESISQGIIEIDKNRVVYVNPQALRLMDIAKEKFLGADINLIFPASLIVCLKDTQSGEISFSDSAQPSCIKINERQVVVEKFPLEQGKSVIVVLSDVTERRRMESVIEATNLTENLGFIFSGIRHEIGNPVNSIKMALTVLQRNIDAYDIETINDFLLRSLDEVGRMEYLLTALKNYSLFETPLREEVSVAAFLHNFMTLIKNDLTQQNIGLEVLVKDNDLLVLADTRALHHIMLNLLTNSADAVRESLEPRIIIQAQAREEWVQITVNDNGKGISRDDQVNLFKPFFTSKTKGTGLGLVNVRKMVMAMNGHIELESYEGLGTTVTIKLPGVAHA